MQKRQDQRGAPGRLHLRAHRAQRGRLGAFDAGTTTDDETLANSAFEWDFDNNGSYEAVGKVMPHTFASDGDKTVRLRVTDSLNRTDTVTAVVHVNRPPVANFVYTPRVTAGEGPHRLHLRLGGP